LNTWLILRVRGVIQAPDRNDRLEVDRDANQERTKSEKEG